MTNEQIIERLAELLCDQPIEDQLDLLDKAIEVLHQNWEEMKSVAWEGYEP